MYKIFQFAPGTYSANQVIAHHVFADGTDVVVLFPPDLESSRARSLVAANAEAIFGVQKNGAQIATMTFTASGSVATFGNMAAQEEFADGDYLTVVASATPDSTLAGIAMTLFGERALKP